ncbi:MAG: sulfotransferase [Nocardioidaceae bacterium]
MTPAEATTEATLERPLVFVTVGSDHHRFDRLVQWVDAWLDGLDADTRIECFVQYGTSSPPRTAQGQAYLDHDEMMALVRRAAIVVTQGGPTGIQEARRAGKKPIVLPRSHQLGEHVDDHQQAFVRKLAADELVLAPDSRLELAAVLDKALADPGLLEVVDDPTGDVARAVQRIDRLADQLIARPPVGRPRVLLIVGWGRSGSTLLERVLGDVPGVVALGETVHLWERALGDDELCGCGQRFSDCSFWQRIGDDAYGGWSSLDAQQMVALRNAVVRNRRLPELLTGLTPTTSRLRRRQLSRTLTAMFRAAADGDGARLVVDSSKMPAYAALLRHADVDLRCVYLVRDPRGVAYSWSKQVRRPEVVDGSADMPQYRPTETAVWWSAFDLLVRLLARRGTPVTTVRYEDFVADPRGSVSSILRFAGLDPDDAALAHIRDDRVTLRPAHQIAGNPMRFEHGEIVLRPDEDWRAKMPVGARRAVGVLTAGLRRRRGYR